MIAKSGYILQVDKSGRLILSSHNDYQKNTPVKSNLKKVTLNQMLKPR